MGLALQSFEGGRNRVVRSQVSILIATALVASALASSAHAATGAGADDGASESSVRLPKANQASGPADSASTVKAPISEVSPPKANGFDELSVSIGNETYVSQPRVPGGANSYQEVSARVRGKTQGPLLTAAIDAGASVAGNVSNYSNVEVPEAYFKLTAPLDQTKLTKHVDFSAGRKKERWSGLDSDWSLGLVQPFNKFDALRPTEQGLTGAFLDTGIGPISVLGFVTPLFIPEQGAPYELSNGRFTTSSPWFSTPPDTLILLDKQRNAVYNIAMPSTSSVMNHASYGFRVRAAETRGEGFYAQGSFLRAPMNAINLGFTGQLSIQEGDSFGDVTVIPEVVYHTVTAADAGYAGKNVAVGFSVLHENPDQPVLYEGLTTSRYSPMTMISPSAEFKVLPAKTWGPRFRFSYLDTTGGDVTPVGEYAQNGNMFGPRTMFRRAFSSSIDTTLYHSGKFTLDASARWIEELAELGTVLESDIRMGFGRSWRVAIQGDLLGSRQPTSYTDTFIARFRANDRAAIRLSYLF